MKEILKKPKLHSVLLVDDDETDLFIAEQVLSKGVEIDTIHSHTSPGEALAFMNELSVKNEQFPDCILLDVQMPVMDAFGFLENAEQIHGFTSSGCRVVIMSSYFDCFEGPEILAKGKRYACVAGFIEKPFTFEKLTQLN